MFRLIRLSFSIHGLTNWFGPKIDLLTNIGICNSLQTEIS